MKQILAFISGILLAFLLSTPSYATIFGNLMFSELDKVDIYLITIDSSDHIYDNFGHTALRIKDQVTENDMALNWGMFDFGDSELAFGLRFYQGIMRYRLEAYPWSMAEEQFIREKRTVWQDRIELTREEKEDFLKLVLWNLKPENKTYDYHYFFRNCTTVIRDFLDAALKNRLSRLAKDRPSSQTFRNMMRDGYQFYNPFIYLHLDILMNSRIDRKISEWEQLFHPLIFREKLLKFDSQAPLLSGSTVLYSFPRPIPTSFRIFEFISWATLSLLLVSTVLAGQRSEKLRLFGIRIFGLISVVLGLWGGALGILMLLGWAFSDHLDLHHNVNAIALSPLHILLFYFGIVWLMTGERIRSRFTRYFKYGLAMHAICFALMAVVWSVNLVQQDLQRVIFYLYPPYVMLSLLALVFGFADDQMLRELEMDLENWFVLSSVV